eukprot:TRINITY_DN5825_c0_g1_i1.p1 TRINITY_DN5825_c0_g1~~TRINITY_DN5825_c0_g1_i1.p1  ORF type:complete len:639 (+),score=163.39 TRINITY_DN5825_c0_g1_i1:95-2011(+)
MDPHGTHCDISPDANEFAVVTKDSRLKVWDALSSQLRSHHVEPNHLAVTYTAMAWGALSSASSSKGKQKKRERESDKALIALGEKKGGVVVWNMATGDIMQQWSGGSKGKEGGHNGPVTGLVFRNTSLFSCGRDGKVIEWNVAGGPPTASWVADKQGLSCLAVNPAGTVLATAYTTIRLWDLSSLQSTLKISGHPSTVQTLAFSPDGLYLLSSAGDRFINLWSTEPGSGVLKVFTCETVPRLLKFNPHADTDTYHFLAVSEGGVVSVWDASPSSRKTGKFYEAQGTVTAKGEHVATRSEDIVSASFSRKDEIIVVVGDLAAPHIHRTSYLRESDNSKIQRTMQISLQPLPQPSSSTPSSSRARPAFEVSGDVRVLGAGDIPVPGLHLTDKKKKKAKKPASDDEEDEENEEAQDGSNGSLPHEPTLQERLAATSSAPVTKHTAQAGSMHTLLAQAIHTSDQDLIERCLTKTNSIRLTVRGLPTKHTIPLINVLVTRLNSKPHAGNEAEWLREVLVQHTAYLMNVPTLVQSLAGLHAVLDARLSTFQDMLKLSGRLDLLLAQSSVTHKRADGEFLNTYTEPDPEEEDEDEDEEDDEDLDDDDDEDEDEDKEGDSEDDLSEIEGLESSEGEGEGDEDLEDE